MESIKLSNIINDFKDNIGYSKRQHFINCFNKHMQNKYGKIKMESFYKDYQKLVVKAAKILDTDYELSLESLKKKFYRIFNDPSCDCIKSANKATFNIPRLTVIHIAFVLTDKTNETLDRLAVANELLLSLGYPQLRASVLIEIFIIYALNQRLSYNACVQKYNAFLEKIDTYSVGNNASFSQKTTTTFHKQVCDKNYENDNELFLDISSILNSMREVSLKVKENFCNTLENIKAQRRMSKIRIQCEFFLTFVESCQKAQLAFNEKFPISSSTGKTREEYFAEIDSFALDGMSFIPIGKVDSKKAFKSRTIIDALDMVEKGKAMLSREAYLLWLLYCGYDTKQINFEISSRYEPLNKKVYFDAYVMIIGNFFLRKDKQGNPIVEYENAWKDQSFIIEDDIGVLDTENNLTFRKSIVDMFTANFDKNFAAERFINTKDSVLDKIV